MNRRPALAAAALLLTAVGLVGCGSAATHRSAQQTHVMSDGRTMSDSSMSGSPLGDTKHANEGSGEHGAAGASGPSEAAAMVCSDEIRTAVARTLRLTSAPQGLQAWQSPRFRCSYLLGPGELRLSVQDLDSAGPGRAFFDALRAGLPHVRGLRGVESLGLPSFETARGDVAFLKDHKTLWVDASRLTAERLPAGMSRTDVAYGVAAAVIACWAE